VLAHTRHASAQCLFVSYTVVTSVKAPFSQSDLLISVRLALKILHALSLTLHVAKAAIHMG